MSRGWAGRQQVHRVYGSREGAARRISEKKEVINTAAMLVECHWQEVIKCGVYMKPKAEMGRKRQPNG